MYKTAIQKRQDTPAAWQQIEREFPFLTNAEFLKRLNPSPSTCMGLYISGLIMGVPRPGGLRFPSFQIDPGTNSVRPVIKELVKIVLAAKRSEMNIILWLCQPSAILEGQRPVDHLDNSKMLLTAANTSLEYEW